MSLMTWHSYVYLCNTGPDVNEVIKQPKGGPLISYSLYVGSTIGLVNYSMYLCIWFLILNFIYFMIQLLQKIHGQTPRFYDRSCNLDIKDIGLGSSGALFQNTDLYFSMRVPILCQPCRFVYLIRSIPVLYVKGC